MRRRRRKRREIFSFRFPFPERAPSARVLLDFIFCITTVRSASSEKSNRCKGAEGAHQASGAAKKPGSKRGKKRASSIGIGEDFGF